MKKGFNVTPYEVEGNIDYGKLIREFGLERLMKMFLKK